MVKNPNMHRRSAPPRVQLPKQEDSSYVFPVVIAGVFVIWLLIMAAQSDSPKPDTASASKKAEFCKYPGCTDSPSQFWEKGTGYCTAHAGQLRNQLEEEDKLLRKIKQQGY